MRFPLDVLRLHDGADTYPIHCTNGFYDGFSGWYAVSRPDKCVDFCFWEVFASGVVGNGVGSLNETTTKEEEEEEGLGGESYDATNTADPHNTTSLPNAEWRCLLNAGNDSVRWGGVGEGSGQFSAIDLLLSSPGAFGPTFEYLRCHRGANEVLSDAKSAMAESSSFWTLSLVMSAVGFVLAIGAARRVTRRMSPAGGGVGERRRNGRRRRVGWQWRWRDSGRSASRIYREASTVDTDSPQLGISLDAPSPTSPSDSFRSPVRGALHGGTATTPRDDDRNEAEFLVDPPPSAPSSTPSTFCPEGKTRNFLLRCGAALAILALSVLSLAGSFLSIMSLAELSRVVPFSDGGVASMLTPKCFDPASVCEAGNRDIDKRSEPPKVSNGDDDYDAIHFSYLVVSDPQLYWWAGESPHLGRANVPAPCDENSDTCSSCTDKVGRHSNRQMRTALENLARPSTATTLVVNGDLAAYFHPRERDAYETYYHSIPGISSYFPALGNHDYDHYSGGRYGIDQWVGPANCNARHAMAYLRSAFCGHVPGFDPQKVVRYDASSLAYSWEEGRYHFVHVHFYPAYESLTIGLRSSVTWLERDLRLANEANLTSVLFVHASQGLNAALNKVMLGRNVKAVFAGHSHRCLMKKCFFLRTLRVREVFPHWNITDPLPDADDIDSTPRPLGSDKCIPGALALCGGHASDDGTSLWYLTNKSGDFTLPETKLFYEEHVPPERKLCRRPAPIFVNHTDNTMLCTGDEVGDAYFPPKKRKSNNHDDNDDDDGRENIPIFWSGSASFETFLQVDFYPDRLVVNVMTASAGMEGRRFADAYHVPNAVYPYHEPSDVEEVTIQF